MQRFRLSICALTMCALILLSGTAGQAAAQGTVVWEEPVNLSNSPTSSVHPAVVADGYGWVHVFWSEDPNGREIGRDELPDDPDTIMYRRWDGQNWTEPLDILAVPDESLADFVAATVDDQNQLHLVWTGLSNLYYSTAPATEAYSVRAWATPQVIAADSARSQFETDVAIDELGTIHVVFAARGVSSGVFHTSTTPGAPAWTSPVRVSRYLRPSEVAFKDVRLVIDGASRLHASWGTANANSFSQALYYARSEQAGETWDEAVMLADAAIDNGWTGLPSLLATGQDSLLLIHADQGNKGRIERTSADAGKTWSEPRFILSGMEGINGFLAPLRDGAGNLHLVINMRPSADQKTGIYYAPRAGQDWSPVLPVAVDEPSGPTAHYTDATVRLGNEIHVAWTQLNQGEIWYVKGTVDGLDPSPAQPIPTPAPQTDVPRESHTGAVTPEPDSATPTAAELVAAPISVTDRAPATLNPIVAGLVPAVALVAGVVLLGLRRRR